MTSKNENSQAITLDDGAGGEFVKEQQCKKATRVWIVNSFSVQRWKLDGTTLKEKGGLWKSEDSWTFKDKDSTEDDGLIYIENTSQTKVLEATSDGKVILEELVEGKAHQLWKKGTPDGDGYFILINSRMPKLITAISNSSLVIKGNITLRCILLSSWLFVDNLPCCFFTCRSYRSW